jgi:O-antigen/teichoic acid export membrane protein
VISQIGLGALGTGAFGLLFGLTIGRMIGAFTLYWQLRPALPFGPVNRPALSSLAGTAWQHRRFPMLTSWSNVINVVSLQISILVIGFFYAQEFVGWFSLALLVVGGPVFILNEALLHTFLSEAGGFEKRDQRARASLRLFSLLCKAVTAPMLFAIALAPDVFSWAFGGQWRAAGTFAALLAPSMFAVLIGAHLPAIVMLTGKQREELVFNGLFLLGRVGALTAGALLGNAFTSVAAYSATSIVMLLAYHLWLLSVAGNRVSAPLSTLAREAACAAALVCPLYLAKFALGGEYLVPGALVSVLAIAAYQVRSGIWDESFKQAVKTVLPN